MSETNITLDFLTLVALGVSWIQMWALIWANSSPKMHDQSSFYFDRWHRGESQRDKVINRWRESVISVSPGIPQRPLPPPSPGWSLCHVTNHHFSRASRSWQVARPIVTLTLHATSREAKRGRRGLAWHITRFTSSFQHAHAQTHRFTCPFLHMKADERRNRQACASTQAHVALHLHTNTCELRI